MPRDLSGNFYVEYPPKPQPHDAVMCWGNFAKRVFYGYARWPSYSEWIVPGTITDIERCS